jgi:hypothetical protein
VPGPITTAGNGSSGLRKLLSDDEARGEAEAEHTASTLLPDATGRFQCNAPHRKDFDLCVEARSV